MVSSRSRDLDDPVIAGRTGTVAAQSRLAGAEQTVRESESLSRYEKLARGVNS